MDDLFLVGFWIVGASIFPILLILIIPAIVGGRSEPDPRGERPYTVYLSAVCFVALLTLLFSTFSLPHAIEDYANADETSSPSYFDGEYGSSDYGSSRVAKLDTDAEENEAIQGIVASILGILISAAALALHSMRLMKLRNSADFDTSPAKRTFLAYLYAVLLVMFFAISIGIIWMIYSLFELIAPGVAQVDGRDTAALHLLDGVVLTALSVAFFFLHWREAEKIRRPAPPLNETPIGPAVTPPPPMAPPPPA